MNNTAYETKVNGKTITYIIRFGISKTWQGRYAIEMNISEDKRLHDTKVSLSYANPEFAIKKAENFAKGLHKDFTDFQGNRAHFEFVNMGLIETNLR